MAILALGVSLFSIRGEIVSQQSRDTQCGRSVIGASLFFALHAPSLGWSGAILLNSPVGCELRRDRKRGLADGVTAVPAAVTG